MEAINSRLNMPMPKPTMPKPLCLSDLVDRKWLQFDKLYMIMLYSKQLISISFLVKQVKAIKPILFDKDESQVLDD